MKNLQSFILILKCMKQKTNVKKLIETTKTFSNFIYKKRNRLTCDKSFVLSENMKQKNYIFSKLKNVRNNGLFLKSLL